VEEHDRAVLTLCREAPPNDEARYQGVVASAVMCAIFPRDVARRAFLKSVGASTALAAISQFFPIMTASEVFAEAGAPEKKDLKAGFIPITCATPIIMAAPLGFYARHGLNVEVVKTAGWAVIRDKTINKEYDAPHMLAPMPIATAGHVVQVVLGDGKAIRPRKARRIRRKLQDQEGILTR
jgi:nitrate/nitrite transport system substrate-binding protein